MMDYLNPFTNEEYFTHTIQDEDHIEAIKKDYTRIHGRGHASTDDYD